MEETLALVHPAIINCLLICHYLALAVCHKCNRGQAPRTAAAYNVYMSETDHVIVSCDCDVTARKMDVVSQIIFKMAKAILRKWAGYRATQ